MLNAGGMASCTLVTVPTYWSLDDIVKCSIFLKDMNDFAAMNAVYGSYFGTIPPARETVQVAKLPLDVNVEISCIAIKL